MSIMFHDLHDLLPTDLAKLKSFWCSWLVVVSYTFSQTYERMIHNIITIYTPCAVYPLNLFIDTQHRHVSNELHVPNNYFLDMFGIYFEFPVVCVYICIYLSILYNYRL